MEDVKQEQPEPKTFWGAVSNFWSRLVATCVVGYFLFMVSEGITHVRGWVWIVAGITLALGLFTWFRTKDWIFLTIPAVLLFMSASMGGMVHSDLSPFPVEKESVQGTKSDKNDPFEKVRNKLNGIFLN
jgi:hypothetical protein